MKTLSEKYPRSKLLFMGLLPRGPKPNPLRVKNDEINKQLSVLLNEIPNSIFMDVDDLDFVQSGTYPDLNFSLEESFFNYFFYQMAK